MLTDKLLVAYHRNHCFIGKLARSHAHSAARNHVNRMCLASNVPLIESGTEGYLGQVGAIVKVCIVSQLICSP